ncbi:TetR/AcrR family transcriptional regulator [Nonomuraea dietziae]|uniref:TetR/AcrR family transcriptional regulator n=1 Tax=Nonomuraea dietziae TaxID=65515 RepID=UPI0036199D5B
MPRKSDRRDLLADTALRLIDDSGLAQVTHRAIDKAAGVPDGTTSNYFRTRSALYEAIVRRLLDLQLADLDRLAVTPLPGSPAELLDLLAATVEAVTARPATATWPESSCRWKPRGIPSWPLSCARCAPARSR